MLKKLSTLTRYAFFITAIQANADTDLLVHTITIGGKVVSPGCIVTLDSQRVRFTREDMLRAIQEHGNLAKPLILTINDCIFNGVGIRLNAEVIYGQPGWGQLRRTMDNVPLSGVYYTIGPQFDEFVTRESKIVLAVDSPALEKANGNLKYYRLDDTEYLYEARESMGGDTTLEIPLQVVIWTDKQRMYTDSHPYDGQAMARFTLTLSYR